MKAMKRRARTLSVAKAVPASPPLLGQDSRRANSFLIRDLWVLGGTAGEGRWGWDGACLESVLAFSHDPIGTDGGMNLYEYVGDSPTDKVDSSGLATGLAPAPVAPPQPYWPPAPLVTPPSEGPVMSCMSCTVTWVCRAGGAVAIVLCYPTPCGDSDYHPPQAPPQPPPPPHKCKPCVPPVGSGAFRGPDTTHGHYPFPAGPPHFHVYVMQQSPWPVCQCFWHNVGVTQFPPIGTVPITPAGGGGPM